MKRSGLLALLFGAAVLFSAAAHAVTPGEVLSDPALEKRARTLSAELRCLVCQNQSIDDSNAELARDLRLLVRERLVAGDSDEDVINYVVSRYGEFVLLKPRFNANTLLLWGAPLAVFLIGAVAAVMTLRGRQKSVPAALSAEEKAELERLTARTD